MSDFKGITSLLDLRGMGGLDLNAFVSGDLAVENIVLPNEVNSGFVEEMFNETISLLRVWTQHIETPAKGVVDISKTTITGLGKAAFNIGSGINKIILPDTIIFVPTDFDTLSGDIKNWQIFGQSKNIDYICNDTVVELITEYISYVQANPHSSNQSSSAFVNFIKINGIPVFTSSEDLGPDIEIEIENGFFQS